MDYVDELHGFGSGRSVRSGHTDRFVRSRVHVGWVSRFGRVGRMFVKMHGSVTDQSQCIVHGP